MRLSFRIGTGDDNARFARDAFAMAVGTEIDVVGHPCTLIEAAVDDDGQMVTLTVEGDDDALGFIAVMNPTSTDFSTDMSADERGYLRSIEMGWLVEDEQSRHGAIEPREPSTFEGYRPRE